MPRKPDPADEFRDEITSVKTPKTFRQLLAWLQDRYDTLEHLDRFGQPNNLDFWLGLDVEAIVSDTTRVVCRFGGPAAEPTTSVTEALAGVGRQLAWAQERAMPAPRLLTVEDLANMLGMSTRTVWRRVSAGEIPDPVKVGGLTKWRRSDIERWLHG